DHRVDAATGLAAAGAAEAADRAVASVARGLGAIDGAVAVVVDAVAARLVARLGPGARADLLREPGGAHRPQPEAERHQRHALAELRLARAPHRPEQRGADGEDRAARAGQRPAQLRTVPARR